MTLHKTKGRYYFECDSCGELLDTESTDFREAVAVLRDEEWKHFRDAGELLHECPDCSKEVKIDGVKR